jgi:hypothetical protein
MKVAKLINKFPIWFRKLIRMCEHRDCNEIFVPLRNAFFRTYYLCDRHKHHANWRDYGCFSACERK